MGSQRFLIVMVAMLLRAAVPAVAQEQEEAATKPARAAKTPAWKEAVMQSAPKPSFANVAYGQHPRQVLDFWKADSTRPAPVVVYIHGGGWRSGDKDLLYHPDVTVGAPLADLLKAGISVASIEYRLVPEAQEAGVKPPIAWPLQDAARAIQFIRSMAGEWNVDKTRIAAMGGSAGASSSLWLALHDDMADPAAADPVLRESTRLSCVAANRAPTSLDPKQMREWIPNSIFGSYVFGIVAEKGKRADPAALFERFLASREEILPWIKQYSPYELVTPDDPPVYLFYSTKPAMGQEEKDPVHSANFGVKLQEKLREAGVECHLVYPRATDVSYRRPIEFLIAKLKGKTG